MIGDHEPEDAWHPDDPPDVQLEQLRRRVLLLFYGRQIPGPVDTLEQIADAVGVARRRRDLTARDTLRADHLDEDIAHVAGRL